MTDITKCINEKCPIRDKCYRHTAKDGVYEQSYSYFEYKDDDCEYFWYIDID